MKHQTSVLTGNLLLFYVVLVVYVSLSPFSGWQRSEDGLFDYLWQPWPRYLTRFDVAVNVIAYFPLGFLLYAFTSRLLARGSATIFSIVLGIGLSLALETSQTLMPERIASNIDFAANTAGCLSGVLMSAWFSRYTALESALISIRNTFFLPGASVEVGLALLVVWLFSQLNPSIPFLGAGLVADAVIEPGLEPDKQLHAPLALGIAFNLCGVGLLITSLARQRLIALVATQALFATAFCLKLFAAEILLKPQVASEWHSEETLAGLAIGSLLLLMLSLLPLRLRTYVAAVVILAGAMLTKLAGTYGAIHQMLRLFSWPYGQLLNFAGLTLYLNEIWPLLALIFLFVYLIKQRASAPTAMLHDRV